MRPASRAAKVTDVSKRKKSKADPKADPKAAPKALPKAASTPAADAIVPAFKRPLLPPRSPAVGSNVAGLGGLGGLGGKQFPLADDRSDHGDFGQQTFELPHDHGWKAAPGHKVFVANRGDVRFEFPERFVITHRDEAICFHDAPPPDDACRISLTIWPLPPEAGRRMMDELDLGDLLRQAAEGEGKKTKDRAERPGPVTAGRRLNYEWAWLQYAWNDKESGRVVRARTLMARTPRVALLITFEFYRDLQAEYEPTFGHLMATLRLSEPVTLTMRQGLN